MTSAHSFPTSSMWSCAIMRALPVKLSAARSPGNAMTTPTHPTHPTHPADVAHAASHPFGILLKRYRTLAGLTQESLAARAGISVRAVSDLERGVNRTPRPATLDLLADALRLGPADRAALIATAHPGLDAPATTPSPATHSGAT